MELTSESVLALAPDASSVKAAQALLKPGQWPTLGFNENAVWGECKGSGSKPYQVEADLSGPVFKCTCPSRKFPCKHSLALLLLLACQLWPTFLTGGLYCPPEMKLMDTVREALASGQWFAPLHNGDAQLPVFVWMLAALDLVARMVPQLSAFVWPAGAALGGLACLWGTWALSRAAGFGPQAALASGLILLSSLLFPQLAHFMGPQGLATGLCLLSMAFFCMGWKKEHAWISLPLAFLTSGLAALTGGLVFLILPLLTSLVHLFWTWRIRRAQRLDALAGFLLLLLLGTLWAAAIIFWVQAEGYAQAVSGKFISLPWPLPAFWWLAPALAVLGLLPWLFVVTGVNWGRVFATSWKTLRASRKENSGSSFLWIALFFSLPLSLLGSGLAGATPALCLLAILLGRALVRMGSLGSKFFYLVIALLFLHAGMLLAALHFPVALEWLRTSTSLAIPQQYEALLTSLDALPVLGSCGNAGYPGRGGCGPCSRGRHARACGKRAACRTRAGGARRADPARGPRTRRAHPAGSRSGPVSARP